MFKCKSGCKAECCGNVPLPKTLIKKNKAKIHRKYDKVELDRGLVYPITKDGSCIFLNKDFDCEIYIERPFICKMYGTIEELQCPYIGLDGKPRTENEVVRIRNEIKSTVDERFSQYEFKYLKGRVMLPPFI